MDARSVSLCTAAGRYWRLSVLTAAVAVAPPFLGSAAWAQADPNSPAVRLINVIPINGTAANKTTKMYSFDISFVDPTPFAGHPNGLYYLADRSNAALDVIDIATETLFGQIGGTAVGFTGDTGNTATSGPDGVAAAYPCIFAGNGNSTLLSFNGAVDFTKVVTALPTGGQFRVDEMAIDPAPGQPTGLVMAANNAEDPTLPGGQSPFSTIATYNKTTCVLSNPIKTTFSALPGGHMNTNGIEQPVWDPGTQRFYVSLPEIDAVPPLAGGAGITGAVARVTTAGVIETIYPINYCQPAGLTLGPNGNLLVGCNSVFDNSGKKCSAVVPSPNASGNPAGAPATCTGGTAYPQVAICNPAAGCTPGPSLVSVFGVGGGDEVWFNGGTDNNYYVTAGNNPIGPTFGVVNSSTNTLTQLVPTVPPVPATRPATPPGHSAGTAHSIAASTANNHVYLPLPANSDYSAPPVGTPACVQGCVAVFSAQ